MRITWLRSRENQKIIENKKNKHNFKQLHKKVIMNNHINLLNTLHNQN